MILLNNDVKIGLLQGVTKKKKKNTAQSISRSRHQFRIIDAVLDIRREEIIFDTSFNLVRKKLAEMLKRRGKDERTQPRALVDG